MKTNTLPRKPSARRARRAAREPIGKLTLREITDRKDGYSWTTFLVQGWREADGRHGRKKFKTRDEAEGFIATKNVELANTGTSFITS